MIGYALYFALGCFGIGQLLCAYRVATATGVGDRILALDTMTVNMIALMALYGMLTGSGILFEIMLLFAMVGFISTVAYAKFLLRGDVIE